MTIILIKTFSWVYVFIMLHTSLDRIDTLRLPERQGYLHDYWILSDCNGNQTHNYLFHKQTLNHLAKLVECSFKNCVVVGSSHVAVTTFSFNVIKLRLTKKYCCCSKLLIYIWYPPLWDWRRHDVDTANNLNSLPKWHCYLPSR